MFRIISFVCAVVLCCTLVSCAGNPVQTINEARFSSVCRTDGYHYDKDVRQIDITVFDPHAEPSDQWELQIFDSQKWRNLQNISPVPAEKGDVYSFFIPQSMGPLSSGQYRLYDKQKLYASNTFAVGELSEFAASDMDRSAHPEGNGSGISMSVEAITGQFLLYSITNLSNADMDFGCGAWLEIQLEGDWYSLPEHIMFEMVNQHLSPGEEYREFLYLGAYDVPLCQGRYRIVKEYDIGDCSDYAYAEFCVELAELQDTPVFRNALQLAKVSDEYTFVNDEDETVSICYPEIMPLQAAQTLSQQKYQTHYHGWCDIAPHELSYAFSKRLSDEGVFVCLCYCETRGIFWTVQDGS